MLLLALLALAHPAPPPARIDLHTITPNAARVHHGKPVVATLTATGEGYTHRLRGKLVTVLGVAGREDDAAGVLLKGNRLDIREGDVLEVRGVLKVIDHEAATVEGVIVPAWSEVVVEEE